MSLLYKLDMKSLPNMWFCKFFFSFNRLPFNFTDGFFYYAEGFEFDVVSLVYFCSSCLCFWWLTCWAACILESDTLSLFYLLLSSPIFTKRHRLDEWIQKQDSYICCLQETHFSPRDIYRLKVKGWKKIFHANGNQKKAGLAILILEKIDLNIRTIIREKEGHYQLIKGQSKKKAKQF